MSQLLITRLYYVSFTMGNILVGVDVKSCCGNKEIVLLCSDNGGKLVGEKSISGDEEMFCDMISLYRMLCEGSKTAYVKSALEYFPVTVMDQSFRIGDKELMSCTFVPHVLVDANVKEVIFAKRKEYFEESKRERLLKKEIEKSRESANPLKDVKGFSKRDWSKVCTIIGGDLKLEYFPYVKFLLDWEVAKIGRYESISTRISNMFLRLLSRGADFGKVKKVVENYLSTLSSEDSQKIRSFYGMDQKEVKGRNMYTKGYIFWLKNLDGKKGYLSGQL